MITGFELDIPSLTKDGIHLRGAFANTRELNCTNRIE